jgi:hypothetical protein
MKREPDGSGAISSHPAVDHVTKNRKTRGLVIARVSRDRSLMTRQFVPSSAEQVPSHPTSLTVVLCGVHQDPPVGGRGRGERLAARESGSPAPEGRSPRGSRPKSGGSTRPDRGIVRLDTGIDVEGAGDQGAGGGDRGVPARAVNGRYAKRAPLHPRTSVSSLVMFVCSGSSRKLMVADHEIKLWRGISIAKCLSSRRGKHETREMSTYVA